MDHSDGADVTRAVQAARVIVGAPPDAVAVWRVVTRLDPGRDPYLLVGLSSGTSGWVVAVSGVGEVTSWAVDPDGAHAWWTAVDDELVWAPGSWSRSPLYPLRRVRRSSSADGPGELLDHLGERVPHHPGRPG